MASADCRRRLIVNADDFGRSHSINQAVLQAHREGILTTASLMVNEAAAADAVEIARSNPTLGVGLHLTLVCGRSTLLRKEIPGLVNAEGSFSNAPVSAGINYFFRRQLLPDLRREIAAQFARFTQTGLPLDHVNGHLNIHLHPTIFRLLLEHAPKQGLRALRLTRDPLWLNLQLAHGRWAYRLSHALVFGLLSRWSAPRLACQGIKHTGQVFGLLQTGCVDEDYVVKLLARLPQGDSELYSHPCLEKFKAELDALVSPQARALLQRHQIQLIRYQDL